MRLQVACLLVGALSLASVRRQKATTASLFDQRRSPVPRVDKKRASQLGGTSELELGSTSHHRMSTLGDDDDETRPLTGGSGGIGDNNAPLEVV